MDPTIIGVVIAAGVGTFIAMRLQKKKSASVGAIIEPLLREKGPLSLPELAEAAGLKGFAARGKVVMALNEMVSAGKVETIPAPEGTPQLKKVDFIKYRLRG